MSPLISDGESRDSGGSRASCLADDEAAKVAELRERLGTELLAATPLFDDDFSMLRWCEGWHCDWAEIVPRFRRASAIIESLGANDIEFEDADAVNDFILSLYPAAAHFTGKHLRRLLTPITSAKHGFRGDDSARIASF